MITSPYYPLNYTPGQKCHRWISVPSGMVIFLKFHGIDFVEQSTRPCCRLSCNDACDFIEIRLGTSLRSRPVRRYCRGHKIPESALYNRHNIIITFVADKYLTASGFNATYTTISPNCKLR